MNRIIGFILVVFSISIYAQEKSVFDLEENQIPFFNLNPSDSFDVAKQKLRGQSYEVTVDTGIISEEFIEYYMINEKYKGANVSVMYPNNQIIEEKENMNFVLWLIQGQIASFTKFNIPQSEFEALVKIFSSKKECTKTEYNTGLSLFVNYELIVGDIKFGLQYNKRTCLGTFVYTNMEYYPSLRKSSE